MSRVEEDKQQKVRPKILNKLPNTCIFAFLQRSIQNSYLNRGHCSINESTQFIAVQLNNMPVWLESFILTLVPLFIVIDALGNLPFVISLSEGMSKRERRKVMHVAAITAAIVGLTFLFFGQFILNVMNISVGSFAIAGGLILLVLSIKYMMTVDMLYE